MSQIPPHDFDIEGSILSGCLLYSDLLDVAIDLIIPEDFYKTANSIIFSAIKGLLNNQHEINEISVVVYLKESKEIEKVGGVSYVASISETYPIPANMATFCEKLKNLSRLRKIINVCMSTSQQCFDCSMDSTEIINTFQTSALNLDDEIKSDFITKEELTTQSLERYQQINNGKTDTSIKTGYPTLDKYLGGGFKGGKLVIIAARPGVGKTALMCNLVANMCSHGVSCGVFSLEMDKEDLDDRWIASEADMNTMKLSQPPGPAQDEWNRILRAADHQSFWPLLVDDRGGLTIEDIKRRARKMVKAGAQIIFIDQLSKIGGNRKMSVFERNTFHVEEIGSLKKSLKIPVVLLAQLNRDLEQRTDKKPQLSDLKNTGQLEEEADIVLLGFRKFIHTKKEEDRSHAEWDIAKNRQGATRNLEMFFNDKRMRFDEIAAHYNQYDRNN